jgi:Gram-negative bacterial TonB protein C-terminal/TPR repeat
MKYLRGVIKLLTFPVLITVISGINTNALAQEQSADHTERDRGIQLYQQGLADEAIEALRGAVSKNHNDADAWHYLGLAYLSKDKKPDAAKAFKQALNTRLAGIGLSQVVRARDPQSDQSSTANRFAAAVQSAEKYLEITPNASPEETAELETLRWYRDFYQGVSQPDEILSTKEVTTRIHIAQKPPPVFSGTRSSGTAVLRALFSADGTVKHILVTRKIDPVFDRACIEAATKIEFTPAMKDGHAVSVILLLEYRREFL